MVMMRTKQLVLLLTVLAATLTLHARNVELIAGSVIGRESVDDVSNIYKYNTAYRVVVAQRDAPGASVKQVGVLATPIGPVTPR